MTAEAEAVQVGLASLALYTSIVALVLVLAVVVGVFTPRLIRAVQGRS